ncbi:Uncharacterized protein APZ42_031539 [Daphnia magna]|uniref:Uncharacterized protein n=1 Tax=Daphnia magna TaxID=35525 RepID=A0A164MSB8_9CRUS|nr:Uncharacterized protein APZ42_031539 [Daphnia magna]
MVKTPNGNLINRAIQSLHPLELREDQPDDVEIPPTPELELESDEATPPVASADPVEQGEPWTTGSDQSRAELNLTATLGELIVIHNATRANESIEDDDAITAHLSGTSSSPRKRSRFLVGLQRKSSIELNEVDRYVNDGYGVLEDLNRYPTIKQIFMHKSIIKN